MGELLNIMAGFNPLPRVGSSALDRLRAEAMRRAFTDWNPDPGDPALPRDPIHRLLSRTTRRRSPAARSASAPLDSLVRSLALSAGSLIIDHRVVDAEGNAVNLHHYPEQQPWGSVVTVRLGRVSC